MTRRQERAAIICAAATIAIVSALAGHHLGVSQGIGEAVELRDENRILASVCGLTLPQEMTEAGR